MKGILILLCVVILFSCSTGSNSKTEKFVLSSYSKDNKFHFFLLNFENDTVLKLNSEKYWVCFEDTVENFLIAAPKDRKGWWAIDFKENFLFQVYNTSPGEPSPDELNFDRIRIVDSTGKIGFANSRGKIVIAPKFEQATAFYKDNAIIGESCIKIPWDTIHKEGDCNHYSIKCSKNGYIDKNGNIIEIGNFKFEELWKKLNFPIR